MDDKVTKSEVLHLAELSRLTLTLEEQENMTQYLSSMLEHFKMLDSVDTSAVPATAHILGEVNVLRADVAKQETTREQLLQNAAESDGECYIVPRVLE